ncbi:hypothetical protein BJ085DRAFT_35553 [Dimargaris cristalligena]|uniref:Arrestin C-terminal-like domain-containing protein n=1 Tax=Dimargaris cristalligena TaxID=215637 RepID=A0A4V1J4K7_9FUNG|nr:hypothetical protein BJ085DRAFT_35553 [Dimargaris cristalligena]|eukprot:RKP35899.1 hypothetical protein BJ085DRAFT_35553 [Dimargaris cristalligena]
MAYSQNFATVPLIGRTLNENIYCPPPRPDQSSAEINPLCILLDRSHIKEASDDFTALCRSANRLSTVPYPSNHHHTPAYDLPPSFSSPSSPSVSSLHLPPTSHSTRYPQSQPVTPLGGSPVLNDRWATTAAAGQAYPSLDDGARDDFHLNGSSRSGSHHHHPHHDYHNSSSTTPEYDDLLTLSSGHTLTSRLTRRHSPTRSQSQRSTTQSTPPPSTSSALSSTGMFKRLAALSSSAAGKVHPSGGNSAPLLRIITTENVLIFRGGADESRGRILRGTVCLSLTAPLKTKAIRLTFQGIEKIDCYLETHPSSASNAWGESNASNFANQTTRHVSEKRTLISHDWTFVTPKPGQTMVTLQPGSYAWPFEIALPGDLPESLTVPHGQVAYVLRAEVERPTLCFNIVEKKTIIVQRYAIPNESHLLSEASQPPWYSGYHKESNIRYSVQVPNSVYAFGELIPVHIRLRSESADRVPSTATAANGMDTSMFGGSERHTPPALRDLPPVPLSPTEAGRSPYPVSPRSSFTASAGEQEETTTDQTADSAAAPFLPSSLPHKAPFPNPRASTTTDRVPTMGPFGERLSNHHATSRPSTTHHPATGPSSEGSNHAGRRHLGVHCISVSINEYTYYTSAVQSDLHRRVPRVVQKIKLPLSPLLTQSDEYETTAYIRVPKPSHPADFKSIAQNCRTQYLKVKHKIKVGIEVKQEELQGKILVTLPITIMLAPLDHMLEDPPVYRDDDCRLQDGDLVETTASASNTVPNSAYGSPVLTTATTTTNLTSACSTAPMSLANSPVMGPGATATATSGAPTTAATSYFQLAPAQPLLPPLLANQGRTSSVTSVSSSSPPLSSIGGSGGLQQPPAAVAAASTLAARRSQFTTRSSSLQNLSLALHHSLGDLAPGAATTTATSSTEAPGTTYSSPLLRELPTTPTSPPPCYSEYSSPSLAAERFAGSQTSSNHSFHAARHSKYSSPNIVQY